MDNKILSNKANSITLKAVVIAALTLLMLIPVEMVKSLINERENVKESVKKDISAKWGKSQSITGPILVLPYKDTNSTGKEKIQYAYFLPESLTITGDIKTEGQTVGMFTIPCYQSNMQFSGKFNFPQYEELGIEAEQIDWDNIFVILGIPSLQGIKNNIDFNWNGKVQEKTSNIISNSIINSGLSFKTPTDSLTKKSFDFSFDLILNGTDSISFTPIGKQTHISMKSPWKYAEFIGDFLPTEQKVGSDGFQAKWDIFDFNRNYPQMWKGANDQLLYSKLGIDLQNPVDQYRKTMRAVKYAVLFISLTFLVFFIIELLSSRRIHPIQYLLVSFGLLLFYCLLLSISEHIGFHLAYVVSAVAIVSLITIYSKSVFKNIKQTIFMGGFLTILYTYLYVVLQAEDTALLLGSIGLFIILAIVMYVSRKVNWYKKEEDKKENITPTPPPFNQQQTSNENNDVNSFS